MCPSFSLCACKILKMRSCLRSPLAPGSSNDRAILVSSVIFFSFSSAMVIFTYVDFLREGFSRDGLLCRRAGTRRSCLSSSPLCFGKVLGFAQDVMTFRIGDFVKNIVHGFLNAGIRLMKPARCLRGKLAKHIPVSQSMKRVKYTIGAHVRSFSFNRDNFGDSPIFCPHPLGDGRLRSAKLQRSEEHTS